MFYLVILLKIRQEKHLLVVYFWLQTLLVSLIGEGGEIGRGLVKLVKSWLKVNELVKLVKSWWSWWKVGEVGEVGRGMVKLVKSWWQVGEKLVKLVEKSF